MKIIKTETSITNQTVTDQKARKGGFKYYEVAYYEGRERIPLVVRVNVFERAINWINNLFSKKQNSYLENKINRKFKTSEMKLEEPLAVKTQKTAGMIFGHKTTKRHFEGVFSDEGLRKLEENLDAFLKDPQYEKAKKMEGGGHTVIVFDDFPKFVFKFEQGQLINLRRMSKREKIEVKDQAKQYKKAEEVCRKNNLDKVHIPRTWEMQTGGVTFEVQERANVVGKHSYQKGKIRQLQKEKNNQKELTNQFKQLVTFIIKAGFTDVKPDNIPLNEKGQFVLYDLDENRGASMSGLYSSGGDTSGLMGLITLDSYNKIQRHALRVGFSEMAKGRLSPGELFSFIKRLRQMKKKRDYRREKIRTYDEYLADKRITDVKQPISTRGLAEAFDTPKEMEAAQKVIDLLNQKLEQKTEEDVEIRRARKLFLSEKEKLIWELRDQDVEISEILSKLQEEGFIFYQKEKKGYGFQINL